ncbi:MAG: aspartate kinase [Marinifilaceae bacterium]|nr:aspartate kinase [Marinifilaceae bacterium]
MDIFKFGGASINSAEAIINFSKIIKTFNNKTVVVLSAMGKTTNMLEQISTEFFIHKIFPETKFLQLKKYHFDIMNILFKDETHTVYEKVNDIFEKLEIYLKNSPSLDYDFDYDQIVSQGEILSTTIISDYLNLKSLDNEFVDIRDCLITDSNYRDASIDWALSKAFIKSKLNFECCSMYVTQGFIASTITKHSTTLGREGSDYTAAVLANILGAKELSIWKDVDGIMTADPKWIPDAEKLNKISYKEAIELAYYGAKVIHPKTIQPLHEKKISLHVRSFTKYTQTGTYICELAENKEQLPPVYIKKDNQLLISISRKDLSFVNEQNISQLFGVFSKLKLKVNLIQTSAISFSVCVDNPAEKLNHLIESLKTDYFIKYNNKVELISIRHYSEDSIKMICENKEKLLEQKNRNTVQFVFKVK